MENDEKYKDPILRELERQQAQGFLQTVNGRVDRQYEFQIRTDGRAQGLPVYLEVARDVPFIDEDKKTYGPFKKLAKRAITAWYGWVPGDWKELRKHADSEDQMKIDGIEKLIESFSGGSISIDVESRFKIGGCLHCQSDATGYGTFTFRVAFEKAEEIPIGKIKHVLNTIGLAVLPDRLKALRTY